MITRRSFAVGLTALGASTFGVKSGAADKYPSHPIKILVPAGPGGPSDIVARLASQALTEALGQSGVVDHRPGAGGVIAARELVKSAPDGYTLLCGGTAMLAVIPALSRTAGYDPTRDFTPIAEMMNAFQVLVVRSSAPWKSIEDLLSYAKANPGKLNFAHIGPGHLTHLAGELLMANAGVSILGVPYRGTGESLTAVLGGSVEMTFESIAIVLPLIREGTLRGLAVTGRNRTPLAPELPTLSEAGLTDYEVTTFFGAIAPAGTPKPIVQLLNATLNDALSKPSAQQMFANLGAVPRTVSPDQFGETIASNVAKWRTLGRTAHIQIN